MILNPGKCHFTSIGQDTHGDDVFYYDNVTLKHNNEEEILGVNIDRRLTFHQPIKKMCHKAGQKLSVLLRLSPYLDTSKRKTIYTTMVKSQLNQSPRKSATYNCNDQLTDFQSLLSNSQ